MKVNIQNTRKIVKNMEKGFLIHITFSTQNYKEFSKQNQNQSFNKKDYREKINEYIVNSDILAKITKTLYKSNLKVFTVSFPEFEKDFKTKEFIDYVFDYVDFIVSTRSDSDNLLEIIDKEIDYVFTRECILLLIQEMTDQKTANEIIDEYIGCIELECYDCFTIKDIYETARKYSKIKLQV